MKSVGDIRTSANWTFKAHYPTGVGGSIGCSFMLHYDFSVSSPGQWSCRKLRPAGEAV